MHKALCNWYGLKKLRTPLFMRQNKSTKTQTAPLPVLYKICRKKGFHLAGVFQYMDWIGGYMGYQSAFFCV